jgi:signal transduction histidine kinase
VADDNADMRDYLARLLGERGYEVSVAYDGEDALEQIRRGPPDLVLSDIMMPRRDGFELLAALREDGITRELPVILLSARAGEEARVEGMRAGATDYLIKPFSARELIARVDSQVARARGLSSERRTARERAEELARLHEFFSQAPAAIAVLRGPDLIYELANEEYVKMVSGRDVLGKPIREALPELVGHETLELLDDVRATAVPHVGRGQRLMLANDDAEPRERFFDFVYQPIVEEEITTGVFVHAVDVTEQLVARREAESANRAKSDFLAAMSHELRTPLNAIAGYAQLLELGVHGPVTDAQREALGRIRRSEQHLLALVNDVLNFAKVEAGRVDYEMQAVSISLLFDSIRAVIEPQMSARSLTYVVRSEPGLHAWADPEKSAQVLVNLLSNATKFTPPGGRITLEARARDAGDTRWCDISVSDTGIGIPLDRQASVFDPFVQVHRRLTQNNEGTGLGLAISRDLARGMGGDISLVSVEGVGSAFTLSLPLAG